MKSIRRKQAAVVLSILAAVCPCAFGLNPALDINQYAHTSWKVREGFCKGVIRAIAQTLDGYLWLGTDFGLLRFDGVRAVPWQPPGGEHLPSSDIRSVQVARDGRLWIGTFSGLASWKNGKLTQYPELDGQTIEALLEDREGTIWVGGWTPSVGRLCKVQSGNMQCYGEDGRFGSGVSALYEDRGGNLWAGGTTGLWRWKPGPPKVYPVPDPANRIYALIESDDGGILIVKNSGITKLRNGKAQPYPLPAGLQFRPHRLLRDRSGGLWIGALVDGGLLHIHKGRTDLFNRTDGLSDDTVSSLFEDREGNIWVSTADGLDRFRDFAIPTISVQQGLSSRGVASILAGRDGSMWLGTSDGLNRWNKGQITIYRKPSLRPLRAGYSANGITAASGAYLSETVREVTDRGLPENGVDSLFEDGRGQIWVATHSGVAILKSDRFFPVPSVPYGIVFSITEDRAGIWMSHQEGLFHLLQERVVEHIAWAKLGHKGPASALLHDAVQGGLWLGFREGGIAYFKDGQLRASYTGAEGLAEGMVDDLYIDGDAALWAATEGGLSRIKDGRVLTLTSQNGLPCNIVHWMMEDDAHSVWLHLSCGLVRIARSELDAWASGSKQAIQATVFDSSDGVGSHRFKAGFGSVVAKSADGRVWFLPGGGVSVIDPQHLPFNNLPPPVHIEQIIADDKARWQNLAPAVRENPSLPALTHRLEIQYTALSIVAPEKNRFKYKLEGYDANWVDAGSRRQAFYTNLPPRNYRFRVIASNNSGVWNEEGASLDIVIPPAWFQTNSFRALCAAMFLGLLWAAYQVRTGQLREQERKFREAVETMPALAFVASADGYRTFVNRRWVEYTGMTLDQASGSGWQTAAHPDDLKRVMDRWRRSVATGEPLEYEARIRRAADGEYRWFQVRAAPLRDKRGRVEKWCGVAIDIEDRKRAEQLQSDLAHTNRVSLLGELAASIAHDVNQPLAGIVSNGNACLRWLAGGPPNVDEARENALRIVRDGKRAGEIIAGLRSLYKKTPPKRELVDVNEIVSEMVLLLRGEATRHGISIRTDQAGEPPRVTADRVQLQQVLMNLMLNAIEAMKETGGVLMVKSQRDENGRVLISVSDTGVGLPGDKADQIFNAFFTTKPQGSGMGLAISRSIVESHGGRLWATSHDGCGATFSFTLPCEMAAHA